MLGIRNDFIRQIMRENPIETIFDREDPDLTCMQIHRIRFKDKNSEVYAEMSARLYQLFRNSTDQSLKALANIPHTTLVNDYYRCMKSSGG